VIAKLMVADMCRSLDFYCRGLGFEVQFAVLPDRSIRYDGNTAGAMFCSLSARGIQVMLQTAATMAEELPVFGGATRRGGTFTLYFTGLAPESVLSRLGADAVCIKGPELSWYGMRELHLADPDGYVICVAEPYRDASGFRIAA
jgi:catechol 2,3-dioxygenase-like lactoylglutathione lyase family enzyme